MSTITPSRPRVRVVRVGPEYALLVVLCQNVLVGPMMGDDDVDDVGDDVLSCHGRYYCLSPTLLPTRRELKLNCSRSRPLYEIALGRPNSDNTRKLMALPCAHAHGAFLAGPRRTRREPIYQLEKPQ